ncbi:hypothetical protein [Actomonas aquatica]|uniref:DUF3887 domain-containing protein n=1 Tax=Actomonas aquatica TaxID=2866162 RepID=A0ABZ1C388_9BACT|nr:hypothetical protein [Opitutus sp. WL0086]WRQ85956.1 hypothetical protein K1X11_014175 [Opitutus sp. WL0086]
MIVVAAPAHRRPRPSHHLNFRWVLAVLVFAIGLTGCSPSVALRKMADDQVEAAAESALDQLKAGDFDALAASIDPELRTENLPGALTQMRNLIPPGEELERSLVNYRFNHQTGRDSVYQIAYLSRFPEGSLLSKFEIRRTDGAMVIAKFTVNPLLAEQGTGYSMSLSGKTPLHYIVLALLVLLPAFTLYTLYTCIRDRLRKHKVWWIFFILIGLTQFSLVWNSGEWGVKLIHFNIPCIGFIYDPNQLSWVFSLSLPVGAILYWVRRPTIRVRPDTPPDLPELPPNPPDTP